MQIFVASDHRGYDLKKIIIEYLIKSGHDAIDCGDKTFDPDDDFTVFAPKASLELLASKDNNARAILICGSGQGMVMAANRIKGIRAGLGWSRKAAKAIRNDENCNVIALPAEIYKPNEKLIFDIIDDFLNTPFAGASRYLRRIKALDNIT